MSTSGFIENWKLEVRYAKEIYSKAQPYIGQWRSELTRIDRTGQPAMAFALEMFIDMSEALGSADAFQYEELEQLVTDLNKLGSWLPIASSMRESLRLIYISRMLDASGCSAEDTDSHLRKFKNKRKRTQKKETAIQALDLWLTGHTDCQIADHLCDRRELPHRRGDRTPHKNGSTTKNPCAERFRKQHESCQSTLEEIGQRMGRTLVVRVEKEL